MMSFTGQHSAATVGGATPAGVFLLELGCLTGIDHQTVVVKEFLADIDVAQGFKKDAVALLLCFQIGFAGVINPLGEAASVLGIDDMAVVQMEVEGVVGLAWVVGVAVLGFLPGDDRTLILQYCVVGFDGTDGVDALAVDARFAHLGAATTGRHSGSGIVRSGGWL